MPSCHKDKLFLPFDLLLWFIILNLRGRDSNTVLFFLAASGLRCCARAFSSCGERGLLFIVVSGLLIAAASLIVKHGLLACGLQLLQHAGSVVAARRP